MTYIAATTEFQEPLESGNVPLGLKKLKKKIATARTTLNCTSNRPTTVAATAYFCATSMLRDSAEEMPVFYSSYGS